MLRVTRLTDYATLLLTVLAAAPDAVFSATALAERTRLELTTVSKVLKLLAQADVVTSFRGVNGGYQLARAAAAINLFDVVQAIEGPLSLTECSNEHGRCEYQSSCGVSPHWRQINDIVSEALRQVSLAQLLTPAPLLADASPSPAIASN
jgi:FeS assembly SUF system regulator